MQYEKSLTTELKSQQGFYLRRRQNLGFTLLELYVRRTQAKTSAGFTLLELYVRRTQAKTSAGFTLLELMVVFSVIVLLTGVGFASYVSYSKKQVLDQAVQNLKTGIDQAKFNAVSRVKPSIGTGCDNVPLSSYRLRVCSSGVACAASTDLYEIDAGCVVGTGITWTSILASKPRPGTITATTGCVAMEFSVLSGIKAPCSIVVTDGSTSKTICVDGGGNTSMTEGQSTCGIAYLPSTPAPTTASIPTSTPTPPTSLPPTSTPITSPINTPTPTSSPSTTTPTYAPFWSCGQNIADSRDSKSYATVQIGTRCWMAANMNVGTRIAGLNTQNTSCSTIQKYCYSNTDSNCTTYGGLYQWNQAMCGASSCNGTGSSQPACSSPVQGICPSGWHIPSHYEYTALERAVCTSGTCATDFPYDTITTGSRGTNEGTKLQSGGSSGFNGLFAGYSGSGLFGSLGSGGGFWSSFENGSFNAWYRFLSSGYATVGRINYLKTAGLSVRCLKN